MTASPNGARTPRTKATPHGDKLRLWARAYRNDPSAPNPERADGLDQAAEYVDSLALPAALPPILHAAPWRDRLIAGCNLLRDALLDALTPPPAKPFDLEAVAAAREVVRHIPSLLETPKPRPKPPPVPKVAAEGMFVPSADRPAALTVLMAIAGRSAASRVAISVHTGCKRRRRDALLADLQRASYVLENPDGFIATPEGRIALERAGVRPLPVGGALAAWWLDRLGPAERPILEYLLDRPRSVVPRTEITAETGQLRRARDAHIRKLVGHGLVQTASRGIELSAAFRELLEEPR